MNPELKLGVKNEVKPYFLTPLWCVTGKSNQMVQYSIHIYPYPRGTPVVRSELEVSESMKLESATLLVLELLTYGRGVAQEQ